MESPTDDIVTPQSHIKEDELLAFDPMEVLSNTRDAELLSKFDKHLQMQYLRGLTDVQQQKKGHDPIAFIPESSDKLGITISRKPQM
jgi:hypothetical protein